MEPTGQHPSDVELELARTGEADEDVCSHIRACPACSGRAAMLDELSAALRQGSPAVQIPELVEARILRHGRRTASRRPRARRLRWAAAAAAAVLLVASTWILRSPRDGGTLSADLNGDGVLDILDAYTLAMRVEAGGAVEATWDIDKNGQIDRRDADFLAMAIVQPDAEIR
jgi:anti-sigma factor RsiW